MTAPESFAENNAKAAQHISLQNPDFSECMADTTLRLLGNT